MPPTAGTYTGAVKPSRIGSRPSAAAHAALLSLVRKYEERCCDGDAGTASEVVDFEIWGPREVSSLPGGVRLLGQQSLVMENIVCGME